MKIAADRGDPEAQSNVGIFYHSGYGTPKSNKMAFKYLKASSDQNHPSGTAQFNLGNFYSVGAGVKKDMQKAIQYWSLSAAVGRAEAYCRLADCYLEGDGVPKNEVKAVECLGAACKKGYPEALFRLGKCYFHGKGVEVNMKSAFQCWKLAARQGHNPSHQMMQMVLLLAERGILVEGTELHEEALKNNQPLGVFDPTKDASLN